MKHKSYRKGDFSSRRLKRRKWTAPSDTTATIATKPDFDATQHNKQFITFFKNKHYGYYTHEIILPPFS